jgi:glycosyltransferase involved in cell wall biosynthesis
MNVEIYAPCHQEAKIIPYFMRHYNQYGKVFLYEGHSTDGSRELAESLGATVINLDTNNEVRDDILMDIRNNCWKASKADWVIVCDMDEFVYHPNFIAYLKTVKETIVCPRTFEMFSNKFPTTTGQIYDEVQHGFEIRPKFFLFQPTKLKEMSYSAGSHEALPQGEVYINYTTEIFCLHMRHLSIDHIVNRNAYLNSRRSEINKQMNWGWHVSLPRSAVEEYFAVNRINLLKVV